MRGHAGAPLKVGIVDSGVTADFLRRYALPLVGAASFTVDAAAGALETRVYDREDLEAWRRGEADTDLEDGSGHGTAVLSLLHSRAPLGPLTGLYLAKVLDRETRGYAPGLLAALEWLEEEVAPDFINLSLGTPNPKAGERLRPLVERAVARGATVFCAAGGLPSYPAQLPSVIAVADEALLRVAGPEVKLDRIVREPTVRIYRQGQWLEVPMATSYACAVAAAEALRECLPPPR